MPMPGPAMPLAPAALFAKAVADNPFWVPPETSEAALAALREDPAFARGAAVVPPGSLAGFFDAAHARCARRRDTPLTAVYVGGSITQQKQGYRVPLHAWLCASLGLRDGDDFRMRLAAMGNVGSAVLFFVTQEWIIAHEPDLVVLECAVNDGDAFVEGAQDATVTVMRAFEGILRAIKQARPACAVVVVGMPVRSDVPASRRTGTKAWVDAGSDAAVAACYAERAPRLHAQLAAHYGFASVQLHTPLVERAKGWFPGALDVFFRDDCHHTAIGAALAASVVAEAFVDDSGRSIPSGSALGAVMPPPCEPLYWTTGAAIAVGDEHVTGVSATDEASSRRRWDVDPLHGGRLCWYLLDPGDPFVVHFSGTGLALLTHLGPDSGFVHCTVSRSDGPVVLETKLALFDRWCYYYRLSVVLIASDLPHGAYTARMSLLDNTPDRAVAKKDAPPGVQGALKLWLSYALVLGARGAERVATLPPPSAGRLPPPAEGGVRALAGGGRMSALAALEAHDRRVGLDDVDSEDETGD